MPRLAMIPPEEMTAAQEAACAEVVSGPRGKVPGPMVAWLRNPDLARRAQKLGATLRFGTSLDPSLRELAILVCARHWTSHHEWTAHKRIALEAGLAPEIIAAVAAEQVPIFASAAQELVWQVAREILRRGHLPPELYARAHDLLGETVLVELVGVLGYYCLVSFTLNVFELGLPEGHAPELETGAAPSARGGPP